MTYSIVARDADANEVGAAVQSAWYSSAGVIVVEAGVGAIVTFMKSRSTQTVDS